MSQKSIIQKSIMLFSFDRNGKKMKKNRGGGVTENVSKWMKNAQKMSDPLTEGAFCSIIETLLNFEIY